MKRIERILQDERFLYAIERTQALEQDRMFCRHDLEHLLAVARIAWIMVLENQLHIDKEIVYGTALLHDLGRYRQYEEQIPHHAASAQLAAEILPDAGFSQEERAMMMDAIAQHSHAGVFASELLSQILYKADKLSRNCYLCPASPQCKWEAHQRNKTVIY